MTTTTTRQEKLAKQNVYRQRRRAWAIEHGRCIICYRRKARKGLLSCFTCSRKKAKWLRENRRRQRASGVSRLARLTQRLGRVLRAGAAAWRAGRLTSRKT